MNASAASTIRTLTQLRDSGLVDAAAAQNLAAVTERYALSITPEVAAIIQTQGSDSAVGRQYIPHADEVITAPEETADPIGDKTHSPVKGIVHRYADRALLMPTQICAVYCRFCFRREAVGPEHAGLSDADLQTALDYIRRTPKIWEVIITGGDPLILSARRLQTILSALDEIPHVATIRIHSRVPIAAPEHIDDALLNVLRTAHKPINIAVHCNHADELTANAVHALRKLRQSGVMLFGQTVLLAGVNDDAGILETLFRGLVAAGVKPYYLHQLDRAPGTERFVVPIARGQEIVKALRGKVSGLAQPTYILDIPGGAGKVPIGPSYLSGHDGALVVEDPNGLTHLL
ncbi:MAG: lysine-2,3-aminomutase-like protein [Rhodospirillaceae bacterium]|nr:lysine-2,3-aminomutase-like protein [Rhodospirillaceae bacterium]